MVSFEEKWRVSKKNGQFEVKKGQTEEEMVNLMREIEDVREN